MFASIILQKTNEVEMNYSKGRKIYITISAILVVAVAVIIFYLSAQNGEESSSTSGFFTKLVTALAGRPVKESVVRSLAHFCEFAGLGLLVANLFFAIKDNLKPFLSIILSSGYAITDEIHQIFVPGRACQLTDLAIDICGIVLGVVVFCVLIFIKCKAQNAKLIRTLHHPE